MDAPRERLVALLKHKGFAKYQPDDPFTLSSGAASPYYFDIRSALLDGLCLREIGLWVCDCLVGVHPQFVGGVDSAGRSLVTMTIRSCYDQDVCGFVVRKESKGHGLSNRVDGQFPSVPMPGSVAVLVEDVITTGASIMRAADLVKSCDVQTLCVLGRFDVTKPLPDELGKVHVMLYPQDIFPDYPLSGEIEWKA